MKPLIFILSCLIGLIVNPTAGLARQETVQGQVRDANTNEPLAGVNIVVKGTETTTTTNSDGRYTIHVAANTTLVFSYIGYESRELPATTGTLDVSLNPVNSALSEVVVVAYGTATKATYTGSASVVSATEINKQQVSSVSRTLQGLVPGLQSVASAGQPGSDAEIRLRGIGSVNASSAPLYVVDGAPYAGDINAINPADIQSISVLKDAAASALYGSRGANGVIIITTKQGNFDANPTVTLNANSGISNRAVEDYSKLSTQHYFELQWEALRNNQLDQGKTPEEAAQYASNELVNTLKINPFGPSYPNPVGSNGRLLAGATPLWNDDWAESLARNGMRNQIDLGISGGGNSSRYFVSGGYLRDQGFIIGSQFTRLSARVNYNTKVNRWFETGVNISASTTNQDAPPQSDSNTGNYANIGRLIANIYPLYERNPDGSYKLDHNGNRIYDFGNYRPSTASAGTNLLGQAYLNKHNNKRDLITFRGHVQLNLVPGLHFKSSINADYTNALNHSYTNPDFGSGVANRGSVTKSASRALGYTFNNLLDYTFDFAERHHVNILAGQEIYVYNVSSLSGGRSNFGFSGKQEPAAASLITAFTGLSDNYKLASFLGKLEYNYDQRYFFSASFRRDGSSRFSPESRWGDFWSLGASWNAKSEAFLADVSWLDNLTIRTSYGAQGNDNLGGYYAYQDLYSIYNSLGQAGLITARLPTPGLKWETNLNFNAALDFAILNNRLSGTFEVYKRSSKDLLFSRPLAPSLGFGEIDDNIGSLQNTGFEGQLQGVLVNASGFRWNLGVNFAHFTNKITELPQNEIISGNVGQLGSTKKLVVGSSVYDFYIREWAGVDPENGKPLWYKGDASSGRSTTSVFADADQYFQGSSLPDFYGGVTSTFTYKRFELSALLAYSLGGKILDLDRVMLSHNGENFGRTWSSDMLNRWTPDNPNTDIPRLTTVTTGWNGISSRFLYDASYARLRNVNLAYTFPSSWTSRIGLQHLRVYGRGENLLTFFGPDGLDPEQAVDGVTFYRYPAQKTFTFGMDISF
ncbi:TonB-linked outer membrane protein, SusC/RagA family [Parapedobacter luteus]|uniref:TonB-linked outer membrane protein, SusC/RagA family n=1 Tax=Parapedobacter luteus TaxID=623280 RepID=A0A1T5D8J8_9SPHI|nr:TonB-dependent receptor [Parapedobacter luteus]SKB67911.1 TonB-linked outer membrane protein, SusC/RagA family [Parapedobacter luteus]